MTTLNLFERYPGLHGKIAHLGLGSLPTPVQPMAALGESLDAVDLYVKRDDLSGELYGGNKVRKLEFLLAEARRRGARTVLTFGAAGSNHVLATALYARQLGLGTTAIMTHQSNAGSVARNLLGQAWAGTDLHIFDSESAAQAGAVERLQALEERDGVAPMRIPSGGSSPLGAVGFVNAGLELATQVMHGDAPEPARIYVALGTMGTVAGMILGMRAGGLNTRVVAVRVVDEQVANPAGFRRLYQQCNTLLHEACAEFPLLPLRDADLEIRHEFLGERYGVFTAAGMGAVRRVAEREALQLEGTYTGKAMAAMIHDIREGRVSDGPTLFWNTYNSRAVPGVADYRVLPADFHGYFQRPVQPLDRPRESAR